MPDYVAVAQAYGIHAVRAAHEREICSAIVEHFELNVPMVIVVDEDQIMATD